MLVVQAGDEGAYKVAARAGADAIVIAIAGEAAPEAVNGVVSFLRSMAELEDRPLLFVRVDCIEEPKLDALLGAVMPVEPDGIVLARCASSRDVQQLGVKLAVLEAELDLVADQTSIVAEIGGRAGGLLGLHGFVNCSPRLVALVWDADGFAAELGIEDRAGEPGPSVLATARDLVLIAARAAEVSAVDCAETLTDPALRVACEQARRSGFNAKCTSDPTQLHTINAVFER